MSKLDDLKEKLFGSSIENEEKINKYIDKISKHLVNYTDTRFETLFNLITDKSKVNRLDPSIKSVFDSFLKNITSISTNLIFSNERVSKYLLYKELYNRIPEIAEAISVYVDNILYPDDFTKKAIKINIDSTLNEDEKRNYLSKINIILEKYKIEEKLSLWINNLLLYGDFFIEIKEYETKAFLNENGTLLNKKIVPLNFEIFKNGKINVKSAHFLKTEANNVLKFFAEQEETNVELVEHFPENVGILTYKNNIIGYLVIKNTKVNAPSPFSTTSSYIQNPTPADIKNNGTIDNIINLFVDKLIKSIPKIKNVFDDDPTLKNAVKNLISIHYNYMEAESMNVVFVPPKNMFRFTIPNSLSYPYGDGILHKVKIIGLYLILLEFAMLIYRLIRSPEKRLFKVEVGRTQDVQTYIQQIIRKTKQKEVYLKEANTIDALLGEISMFEDYFIPVIEGRESFTIDSTPPGELTAKLDDIEYLRKKLISGLGIPALYLVSEENVESKYTLSQENIKFARSIIKYQKYICDTLNNLVRFLVKRTYSNIYVDKFNLYLNPPIALQMERTNEILSNIKGIIDTLSEIVTVRKDVIIDKFLSPFIDIKELLVDIRNQKLDSYISKSKTEREKASSFSSGEEGLGGLGGLGGPGEEGLEGLGGPGEEEE